MMRIRRQTLCLAAAISFALVAAARAEAAEAPRYYYPVPAVDPAQVIEADLVVYGATPGGVMAAIQARRMGKTAVLVEFGRHVGGMTASGRLMAASTQQGSVASFTRSSASAIFRPRPPRPNFCGCSKRTACGYFASIG
jgi:NADPH-dependent 2,4-dienoyl-CoA reductase/sulfur reductase-like enzyme